MVDCELWHMNEYQLSFRATAIGDIDWKRSHLRNITNPCILSDKVTMRLPETLLFLLALLSSTLCAPTTPQTSLSHLETDQESFVIPTRYESTVLARRLLALSPTGVISTIFPPSNHSSPDAQANVPKSVASTPIGLPEYLAACEDTGNPTLLALAISTSTRNAMAGSNVSLALSWWDSYVKRTNHEPWSAANLPRASLIGYLEEMSDKEVEENEIMECYTAIHRDSRLWLPGDKKAAHSGMWMRMVVEEVYWIGGFGDRAYIGWFDMQEWKRIRRDDWKDVRLPGES